MADRHKGIDLTQNSISTRITYLQHAMQANP
jgi:hypothetical protein